MGSRLLYTTIVLLLIHSTIAEFRCLKSCICNGYNISCASQELDFVPNFKTINGANIVDLSDNEIEEIYWDDFNWKGIEQLQFLYLNINSLVYLNENAFSGLINLEYIDLSHNYIEQIPAQIFENNTRLRSAVFSGNMLGRNIPTLVSNSLQHLDLSFTKLSHFTSDNIKHLPNLVYLNLMSNNLIYINPSTFGYHLSIIVNLTYNIWACNCSTIELYNWAKENGNIRIDNPIKCMNKNNIYIDMFNKTQAYRYKESCNINEDSFGDSHIKELSLVKDNTTDWTPINKTLPFQYIHKDGEYNEFSTLLLILVVMIILVSVFIGMALGIYISLCFNKPNVRRDNQYCAIDVRDSYDNPIL